MHTATSVESNWLVSMASVQRCVDTQAVHYVTGLCPPSPPLPSPTHTPYTSPQLEEMYRGAHAKIRKDPVMHKKPRNEPAEKKRFTRPKMSLQQRKARVDQRKAAFLQQMGEEED